MGSAGATPYRPDHQTEQTVRLPATVGAMQEESVDMKAHDHAVIFSIVAVTLSLALAGCHRQPPALAATPPPVVTVSPPLEREATDYSEYPGRTAAVDTVEVRARVSGYLVK